jgi:exodeoxyribonuclease III
MLLMQETKCAPDGFPHDELAAAGYRAHDHSAGRWAGVAIATRSELETGEVVRGLSGEPDPSEARWLELEVAGVRAISLYVPNGREVGSESYDAKLEFLDAARARVAELRGGRLAIAGDVNVAPCDRDVYDPAAFVGDTHVTAPERERLAAILDAGVVDAYRALHPDQPGFTWWDYRQGHFHRGLGMRIDLVLLSAALAEGLTQCGIDRDYRKGPKPSDHAPLLASLE